MPVMLDLKEAAEWAKGFTNKDVTPTNIGYLIQYGKIKKHGGNGRTLVDLDELKAYYEEYLKNLKDAYENDLGKDINWALSFSNVKEKETTKHVHRLHPYKGKFVPQLVEYFLDGHTDAFKKEVYFHAGDIILDPFAGSGTTLVQASELGIHSIGLDISSFNCLLSEVKLQGYDRQVLIEMCQEISCIMQEEHRKLGVSALEKELDEMLYRVNREDLPSDFKYNFTQESIDEENIISNAVKRANLEYEKLLNKHAFLMQGSITGSDFLNTWFTIPVINQALKAKEFLEKIDSVENRKLITIILSRSIHSCRLTPHYQLELLDNPVYRPYYCFKHKKVCRPILSMVRIFNKYSQDTINRLTKFKAVKKNIYFALIDGDSRELNIFKDIKKIDQEFYILLKKQRIKGIFSSPPYLGQLDYHAQHEYVYELFGLTRRDELEIGKSIYGKGVEARQKYIEGISNVLINCKQFLADGFHIFIVANDQYGLYPQIAERSGLKIIQEYKRPVLNRTSRDRNPYSEDIFHMIKKD
jgi:DNA modification methylase